MPATHKRKAAALAASPQPGVSSDRPIKKPKTSPPHVILSPSLSRPNLLSSEPASSSVQTSNSTTAMITTKPVVYTTPPVKIPRPPPKSIIKKLIPPKPPHRQGAALPVGSAVHGPTAKIEGRNVVLVSRKNSIAGYLRRCKKLIVEEGNSSISIHALTTSIPLAFTLLHSLLSILPFPRTQLSYTIHTTSVPVTDEITPEDEEEDIIIRERMCSGVEITLLVGKREATEGKAREGTEKAERKKRLKKRGKGRGRTKAKAAARGPEGQNEDDADTEALNEAEVDDEMDAMNG
ncbi:hypothetical protein [Phaffia rhodozyma]|uniref:Uncharacterized protein n=1 Tax=Phaffia rhodozyma TaxID=264483 RepID=A0A0F7SLE9_PHARH|nr:hypothetical protein [Phaffia rhodozyma]